MISLTADTYRVVANEAGIALLRNRLGLPVETCR